MRTIIRGVLVLVVVVAVAFLAIGLWTGTKFGGPRAAQAPVVGASGGVDVSKARERGAELGEKAAIAAGKVQETVTEAGITTKIKAKMALDDTVKARAIDVSTRGGTVTLSGTVGSAGERDRAVALARETTGVSRVVDELQIRP